MKKLLMWSDSPASASGYGIVGYHILRGIAELFASVDIVCTGLHWIPVNVQLQRQKNLELPKNINFFSATESMGIPNLQQLITQNQYDLVLFNHDFSRIVNFFLHQNFYQYEPMPNIISYGAIDHIFGEKKYESWNFVNQNPKELEMMKVALKRIKMNIPTATHGYEYFQKFHSEIDNLQKPIHYGVDFANFHPISQIEKDIFREQYFQGKVKKDEILMINNNRNTPRKDLLRSMMIFYKVWEKQPICKYYIHTNPGEYSIDLRDELLNSGVPSDKIEKLFIFPPSNDIWSGGTPENIMGKLTASCDINFNVGRGEGSGLSNYQAMATRTLNVIPKHTGMTELVENDRGIEIPTDLETEHIYWSGANPHITKPALIDESAEVLGEVVKNLWNDQKYYDKIKDNAFEWIKNKNWCDVELQWKELFKEILN